MSLVGYAVSGARQTPTNSASCCLPHSTGVSVCTRLAVRPVVRLAAQPQPRGPLQRVPQAARPDDHVGAASTVVSSVRSQRNQREPAAQPGPEGSATDSRSRPARQSSPT